MSPPTEGPATSNSQVQVQWVAVTAAGLATGNSATTEYELLWDNGEVGRAAADFLQLPLDTPLATSHTVVGVTEAASYRFAVRAVNIYGAGVDSAPPQSIRASGVPSPMAPALTVRSGASLIASFSAPANNGAVITAYAIVVLDRSQDPPVYVIDSSCDAFIVSELAADPALENMSCTFAFADLMGTRGYVVGETPQFKASAQNADGWGTASAPNTDGATVMTVPQAMGAPVEDAATSHEQIVLTWSALTSTAATGGTAITSYAVEWDQGTGTWLPDDLATAYVGNAALVGDPVPDTSLSYSKSGITAGQAYRFRLRANNALGWGLVGPELAVTPSSSPDIMATVTTSVEAVNLRLVWAAPPPRGAALTAYRIMINLGPTYVNSGNRHTDGDFVEESLYCPGDDVT